MQLSILSLGGFWQACTQNWNAKGRYVHSTRLSSSKSGAASNSSRPSDTGSTTWIWRVDLLPRRTRTAMKATNENRATMPKSGKAQAAGALVSFFDEAAFWASVSLASYFRAAGARVVHGLAGAAGGFGTFCGAQGFFTQHCFSSQ